MEASFETSVTADMGNNEKKRKVRPVRPATDKLIRVVAGLAEWTEEESAWIVEHPELIEYQRRLALALEKAEHEGSRSARDGFVMACMI